MPHPSVIIRAVSDDITSTVNQSELAVEDTDLNEPQETLQVDSFSTDIHQEKTNEIKDGLNAAIGIEELGSHRSNYINNNISKSSNVAESRVLDQEEDQTETYTTETLRSSALEESDGDARVGEGTVLIVSSPSGYIQTTDDLDNDAVLPLTTLTDPILEHQGDGSDIISSSLDSPDPEDTKDIEHLVDCH
ncbi:DMTF1 factor, partial [Polypterus senegalus]